MHGMAAPKKNSLVVMAPQKVPIRSQTVHSFTTLHRNAKLPIMN